MSTDEQVGRGHHAPGPFPVRWRRAAPVLATAVWLLAAEWGIGSYPLAEPDEGRNGTAALEVATGGHWLLPTFDGVELLDKPLLWFDAAALAILALGPGELPVRLPSLLFTAATVLVVAWFARRLYGDAGGWIAGVALATSPLVLAFVRIAIFDPMLVFFMVLALVLLHEAVERRAGGELHGLSGSACAVLAWLAMAGGVLTKGPVAMAIPLLVALPYAVWRRRTGAVWSWVGGAGFLVLVGGWVAYVESRAPGYVEYVAVTETWSRLASRGDGAVDLGSSGVVRSMVPILIGGALPWSVVAAWAWVRGWSGRPRPGDAARATHPTAFLVLWLVVPVLLFTLAEPKRVQYMLPVVPAVALLLGAVAARHGLSAGALRAGAVVLAPPGVALLAAGTGVWPVLEDLHPRIQEPAHASALALGILLLAAPAAAFGLARARPTAAVVALALPGLLLPAALYPAVARVSELRSAEGLAAAIEWECPGAPVVGLDALPSTLPFYLGRPVGLASATGEPFQSHYVEAHWETIVARRSGDPLLTLSTWDDLPTRVVVVFDRRDQAKGLGAELRGFDLLATERLYAAWGGGCDWTEEWARP